MKMFIARVLSMMGLLLAVITLALIGGYMGLFLSGCFGFVFCYILFSSIWLHRGHIHAVRKIHQQQLHTGDIVEVTITVNLPVRYWLCWIVVEERWIQQKSARLQEMHEKQGDNGKPKKLDKLDKLEKLQNQEEEVEQYACLAYIRGDRSIKCHYTTTAKSRGLYCVHSSRVLIGDMFGLVRRELIQEELEAEIVQVNPIPLGGNWFRHMQQSGGSPTDYGTLRDYIDGDPISSVDWKSYARYQTLKTKQHEVEERKSMIIVMDARITYFESIVSAAARIVREMNDPSLELMLICGDSRCHVIPQHTNQLDIANATYAWLSSIKASSSDSFADQLRTTMTRLNTSSKSRSDESGADSDSNVIGLTMTSDERIRADNRTFMNQHSIQIVYIPQYSGMDAGERAGEMNYA